MASKITTLWDDVLVEASAHTLVAGVPVDVLISGDLDNETGTIYNSIKISIDYQVLTPDISGASFFLNAFLEFKDALGNYKLAMTQFNSHNRSRNGPLRIMIMQPNIDTFNLGVDDIVFPIDRTLCRISRAQGELPQGEFRVKMVLQENNPAGANPFVSVRISGEVEQYNA